MDFRVKYFPKLRVLPDLHDYFRALLDRGPQAEVWLQRTAARLSPSLTALYKARRRIATTAVVIVTVSLFIHVMFGANGMVVYRQKRAEYQQLQKDIDTLQKQNDASTAKINSLQNDPQALEREAREQLHYTRPGEVIYVAPAPVQPVEQDHRSAKKNR